MEWRDRHSREMGGRNEDGTTLAIVAILGQASELPPEMEIDRLLVQAERQLSDGLALSAGDEVWATHGTNSNSS